MHHYPCVHAYNPAFRRTRNSGQPQAANQALGQLWTHAGILAGLILQVVCLQSQLPCILVRHAPAMPMEYCFVLRKGRCSPGWPQPCFVSKDDLKFLILTPLPPRCWGCTWAHPNYKEVCLFVVIRAHGHLWRYAQIQESQVKTHLRDVPTSQLHRKPLTTFHTCADIAAQNNRGSLYVNRGSYMELICKKLKIITFCP